MLNVKIFDGKDKQTASFCPMSLTMQMSLDVPCDDVSVIIPYEKYDTGEKILITQGDEVIFRGIIDEEQIIFNNTGKFIRYAARSLMAFFVDNEVRPQQLFKPTEAFLGNAFVKPFGLDCSSGENIYNGNLSCKKGMSIYNALAEYSRQVYSASPRVDNTGFFDFKGGIKEDTITFDNIGRGARYNSYTEYKRPCNRISGVYVKLSNQGYNTFVKNQETADTSLVRERYIDGSINSGVSGILAERIIESSNKKYLSVKLSAPGCYTSCLGFKAFVNEEGVRDFSFVIREIKYVLNSKGESTTLLLERRM